MLPVVGPQGQKLSELAKFEICRAEIMPVYMFQPAGSVRFSVLT